MCYGQVINSGLRAARKKHQCDWCRETIEPKIRYFFWVGTVEGDFNFTKMHEECDKAYKEYVDIYDYDCLLPDNQPRGRVDWESV